MTAHGIATCAQGSMRAYADLVRETFGYSDEIGILAGLSFGYEDESVPANRTKTTRSDLSENFIFMD